MLEYVLCWITIIICISCLCCVNVILGIFFCNLWLYVRKEYSEYIALRCCNNCLHWLCHCVCCDDFNLRINYHHRCITKKINILIRRVSMIDENLFWVWNVRIIGEEGYIIVSRQVILYCYTLSGNTSIMM